MHLVEPMKKLEAIKETITNTPCGQAEIGSAVLDGIFSDLSDISYFAVREETVECITDEDHDSHARLLSIQSELVEGRKLIKVGGTVGDHWASWDWLTLYVLKLIDVILLRIERAPDSPAHKETGHMAKGKKALDAEMDKATEEYAAGGGPKVMKGEPSDAAKAVLAKIGAGAGGLWLILFQALLPIIEMLLKRWTEDEVVGYVKRRLARRQ